MPTASVHWGFPQSCARPCAPIVLEMLCIGVIQFSVPCFVICPHAPALTSQPRLATSLALRLFVMPSSFSVRCRFYSPVNSRSNSRSDSPVTSQKMSQAQSRDTSPGRE
eukprot:6198476-Pleurochrysis_carterae.AAC.5